MTFDPVVVVGLVFAFGGIELGRWVQGRVASQFGVESRPGPTWIDNVRKWIAAGLLVAFVLLVEGEPLSSIGVEAMAPLAFLGWVVGGLALTMALGMVAFNVFVSLDLETPGDFVADQQAQSVPRRLFTALTAGVTESVLYQGYPIERLAVLTGSLPLAGALSVLVFTGGHYAGDAFSLQEVVFIGVPALCVTVLYVLSGNLLVVVVVHTLVDAISLLSDDPNQAGDEQPEVPA